MKYRYPKESLQKKQIRKLAGRLKNAREALRRVEEKYLGLVENTPDIIYTHDIYGNMQSVNPAVEKVYGYSQEEFIKLNLRDILDKKYLPVAFANISRIINSDHQSTPHEYLTYTKDRSPVWVEVNTHAVTESDDVIFIQGIARDITLRKKYEKAFTDSERNLNYKINYLNALIKNMNELFYTYDLNARITFINDKCAEVVGYNQEEVLGRHICDFVPGQYREKVLKGIHDRLINGLPGSYEIPILHKSGSQRVIRLNVSPIIEAGRISGGMVLAEDITDRKKSEEDLKMSREWFFKAFNASPSIMIILQFEDWRIIDINSSFLNVLGYTREESIGKTPSELCFWEDRNEQEKIRFLVSEKMPVRNREALFKTRTGDTRVGLYSADIMDIGGSRHILLSIIDITDHKHMEKELSRLDKLNLVGEMAAGMGHEIRNPMTAVRGFLQLLSSKKDLSGYYYYFDIMINELDRMNAIISEFLSLAKNRLVDFQSRNLNHIISAIVPLIEAGASMEDKIIRQDLKHVPDLPLDENEIRQLILNLCRNGLEAMDPGGTLTINTYEESSGVVLSVHDQGGEIPAAVLDKMGTPFFSTKENGTGLGLAVCHSIAARHNAVIKIETEPGGTTFYVRFAPPAT